MGANKRRVGNGAAMNHPSKHDIQHTFNPSIHPISTNTHHQHTIIKIMASCHGRASGGWMRNGAWKCARNNPHTTIHPITATHTPISPNHIPHTQTIHNNEMQCIPVLCGDGWAWNRRAMNMRNSPILQCIQIHNEKWENNTHIPIQHITHLHTSHTLFSNRCRHLAIIARRRRMKNGRANEKQQKSKFVKSRPSPASPPHPAHHGHPIIYFIHQSTHSNHAGMIQKQAKMKTHQYSISHAKFTNIRHSPSSLTDGANRPVLPQSTFISSPTITSMVVARLAQRG